MLNKKILAVKSILFIGLWGAAFKALTAIKPVISNNLAMSQLENTDTSILAMQILNNHTVENTMVIIAIISFLMLYRKEIRLLAAKN